VTTFPPITVKVYLEDFAPPPHFPLGTAILNGAGTPLPSTSSREQALCLSYYQTHNVPRYRGRLYVPYPWIAKASNSSGPGARPSTLERTTTLALGTAFKNLASSNAIQWGFASRADRSFRAITNYYVDDEWDVIRKRGLKATTRSTGTVP
jgi:hypothetical protein